MLLVIIYGPLRRIAWISSPYIVVPSILAASSFFAIDYTAIWPLNNGAAYGYLHFYAGAALFLLFYYILGWKLKYRRLDALILSTVAIIAIDELWQIPINIYNWTSSWHAAEIGVATGGFSLMSIPIFFLFIKAINDGIKIDKFAKEILLIASVWTICDVLILYQPYLLVLPWSMFLLSVSRASRPMLAFEPPQKAELSSSITSS